MHAWEGCPNAAGCTELGSLWQMERDGFSRCEACGFDAESLGAVASASSRIENGFEYHYLAVARAASDMNQEALEAGAAGAGGGPRHSRRADRRHRRGFRERRVGKDIVASPRHLRSRSRGGEPVGRAGVGEASPNAFSPDFGGVGCRVAVSGSTPLARTRQGEGESVLASLLDSVAESQTAAGAVAGAADVALTCWSDLLHGDSQGHEGLLEAAEGALGSLPLVGDMGIGRWAADALRDAVRAAGLQPANTDALRPVLVNTAHVAGAVGDDAALGALVRVKGQVVAHPFEGNDSFEGVLGMLGGCGAGARGGGVGRGDRGRGAGGSGNRRAVHRSRGSGRPRRWPTGRQGPWRRRSVELSPAPRRLGEGSEAMGWLTDAEPPSCGAPAHDGRRLSDVATTGARYSMTVELAVALPVLLTVALIAVNAATFFGQCAAFDNLFCDAVRAHGASPAYGQSTQESAELVRIKLGGGVPAGEPGGVREHGGCGVGPYALYRRPAVRSHAVRLPPAPLRSEVFGGILPPPGAQGARIRGGCCHKPGVLLRAPGARGRHTAAGASRAARARAWLARAGSAVAALRPPFRGCGAAVPMRRGRSRWWGCWSPSVPLLQGVLAAQAVGDAAAPKVLSGRRCAGCGAVGERSSGHDRRVRCGVPLARNRLRGGGGAGRLGRRPSLVAVGGRPFQREGCGGGVRRGPGNRRFRASGRGSGGLLGPGRGAATARLGVFARRFAAGDVLEGAGGRGRRPFVGERRPARRWARR